MPCEAHETTHLIALLGLLGLAVAVAPGCPPVLEQVCEPGRVADCACAGGGKGTQTCETGGDGWGACDGCDGDDDDDDNTPPDDDDATPPDDDDDDGGVFLTVVNYTDYALTRFGCAEAGSYVFYDLLDYGYIYPGATFTAPYNIWPGTWDLYVEDVMGYWAWSYCPYLAAGEECYWVVDEWEMQW